MADFSRNDEAGPRSPDAQARAPDGLTLVLVEHRATLLRFLVRRLGNDDEAEDALQDVWIKLDKNPPTAPIGDPLAYLFRMAENAARDLRRSDMRRHARESNWAEQNTPGEIDGHEEPSPEEVALQREQLRGVEARIARLPERTRRIFVAFRLEGVRQKQLAAEHGISLSAVQKHLQRAYRAVIELADGDDPEDLDNDDARMGPS